MHSAVPAHRPAGTLAIVIVGADAALAALPATPVQIAHACVALGYEIAVPASWGDELLAAECLRQLGERGARPAIMCACPHVRSELLSVGPDLAPVLVPLVPPPVAVARYLHAVHGRAGLHLTYVGACPGAHDASIDETVTPGEFLSALESAGISLTDQPRVFDSVIPPDRRRFFSIAGGVPSAEQLWSAGQGRSLVELDGEDYLIDLAQHLLSRECALIDLAPRLGCACSGVSASIPARSARAAVAVVEPPRASGAVIDMDAPVVLQSPIELHPSRAGAGPNARSMDDVPPASARPAPARAPASATHTRPPGAPPRGHRRSLTPGVVRPLQRALPTTRVAGRTMPRAYVACRRPATVQDPTPDRPVTRVPTSARKDTGVEEHGRAKSVARVAAPARSHDDRATSSAIAAGANGAAEKMSDGPGA